MYQVTREIDFCYGHRLLNYDGKCRFLHGHNGRAVITLESPELDGLGMVTDFSEIKRVVSRWIDENLDHRIVDRAVRGVPDVDSENSVAIGCPRVPTARNHQKTPRAVQRACAVGRIRHVRSRAADDQCKRRLGGQ